jgi:light-regulated signal transduction histidine kinase (bacteriophytochrome)
VILPPWWLTWWFRVGLAVVLVLLLLMIYLQRTKQIRKKNKLLKHLVEERTKELQIKNEELHSKNEEIEAQNEELIQSEEEIASQRDKLALQNEQITAAKRVIEAHNNNLEEEIAKRTLELTVQNQQLEQFAFIASHNLRGPVARMLGLRNLVWSGAISDDEKNFVLDKFLENTDEIDKVAHDLTHILNIHTTPQKISTVFLAKELDMAKLTLERQIAESGALILSDFSEQETLQAAPAYVQSIFFNLIDNAIKYRDPNRSLILKIVSTSEADSIRISFSDNGRGIDLDLHGAKIFSLYSRFHPDITGKGKGLFLVKTQLDAMGGKIEVESVPNNGTTFNVTFNKPRETVFDKSVVIGS